MTAEAADMLARRFPDAVIWYGVRTRSWWAVILAPERWRLIEASDPENLTRAIIAARA